MSTLNKMIVICSLRQVKADGQTPYITQKKRETLYLNLKPFGYRLIIHQLLLFT